MSSPPFLDRVLSALSKPHVWISGSMLVALFVRGWKRRSWPSERQVIELLAYGAGIYGGVSLLGLSVAPVVPDTPGSEWLLFAGGVVLTLTAARGAWTTFLSVGPMHPIKIADTPATADGQVQPSESPEQDRPDDFMPALKPPVASAPYRAAEEESPSVALDDPTQGTG